MSEHDPIKLIAGAFIIGVGAAVVLFFYNTRIAPTFRANLGVSK